VIFLITSTEINGYYLKGVKLASFYIIYGTVTLSMLCNVQNLKNASLYEVNKLSRESVPWYKILIEALHKYRLYPA
jgi:hypothetical protein